MRIAVVLLLLFSACCDNNDNDCTQSELQQKRALSVPRLIAVQDNVRVYEMHVPGQWVYFTTPCGDVSWQYDQGNGKNHDDRQFQVNGQGCK